MRTLFILIFILMAGCDYDPAYEPTTPTRVVMVNNQQLDAHALQVFDRLFGMEISDGFYWVNDAGQWGHGSDTVNPRGVINMEALAQMQAEQQQQAVQQGGYAPSGGGGGMPNGRSVNGSVVSGQLNGQNCTFVTASGGMTIKTCN